MQKTDTRQLTDEQGTLEIKTVQLPALRQFKLLARLGKIMGASLGNLKGLKFRGSDVGKVAVPLLVALFDRLDPEDADQIAVSILEGTMVIDGQKARSLGTTVAIDEAFGGRLMTMFRVMGVALEVNYGDFFQELKKLGEAKAAEAEAVAKLQASP